MSARPVARAAGASARDVLTPDRRRDLVAFGAAVLVFVVGEFLHPGFASAESVKAILVIASFVGFVAAGQTFVMLVGGIDLSVPWVLNGAGDPARHDLARPGLARCSRRSLLALGLGAGGRAGQRHRRRLSRRPGRRDDARR